MPLPQKEILIVDDNEDILESLRFLLEEEGYKVKTNQQGSSLCRLLKPGAKLPDLILLDLLLSGTYGTTYAQKLKQQESTKQIPIILMSAHPSARKYIQESCVNEFIPKPLNVDDFLQKVASYTQVS